MTYCGDHFAICTNTKLLLYTSETNIMSINYVSIEKKKKEYFPDNFSVITYLRI